MAEYTTDTSTFANPNTMRATSETYTNPNTVYSATGKHGYPYRSTDGSAGFDLKADLIDSITILAGQTVKISTGLRFSLPPNVAALVLPRSGLALKNNITVANSPGLIDPDYRGEVAVLLRNEGNLPFTVEDGDSIAQLLFVSFVNPSFVSVEELDYTARGANGFGSTDRK